MEPAVAGTALDDGDLGVRHQRQHVRRLAPDILSPFVAGQVERDSRPSMARKARCQPLRARDADGRIHKMSWLCAASLPTAGSSGRISGHSSFEHERAQLATSPITS